MDICHRDAAHHCADDADVSLISAAEEKIVEVRCAVELFVGRTVHRSVVVPGESLDRLGSEDVGVNHVRTEVGSEPDTRCNAFVVPAKFGSMIIFFRKIVPTIKVRDRRDADDAVSKLAIVFRVNVIVR